MGGSGGSNNPSTCGTAHPTLLYTAPATLLRGPVVDDQFVYVLEGISKITKVPKAGGTGSAVATASYPLLDANSRLYLDGNTLYYSDNQDLFSVPKAGGTPTSLVMSASSVATGIDPLFAMDDQFLYFGDKVSNDTGDALGTVNKLSKTGGAATVLASKQAGPGAIAVDDSNVYWVNEGTIDSNLDSKLTGGIGSIPKAGGTAKVLFSAKTDGTGISPAIADLIPNGSDLFFSSINVQELSNVGEYKIAKAGGTPVSFSDCPTLGAFILNGSLYADCGDRISKFDLTTGSETVLVCFPTPLEGSFGMTHDAGHIYYAKTDHPAKPSDDNPYGLYSIPLE
jgi:hypothetical protein